MKLNLPLDTALLVASITAFLYTCGQVHIASYLAVFLIDPVVLNIPPQDKIYWGFLTGWENLAWLILILAIYYLVKYINPIDFFSNLLKSKQIKRKHIHPIHNQYSKEQEEEEKFNNPMAKILLLIFLLSYCLFSIAAIDRKAHKHALNNLENLQYLSKVNLKSDKSKINKYYIFCGSSLCAISDTERRVTLEEPKNIIFLPD